LVPPQRAAAPSLRYARLLRRFYDTRAAVFWQRRDDSTRRCSIIFKGTAHRVAVLSHTAPLWNFILNLKALRCYAKSKFCRFKISTLRLNLKFKSHGKFATYKQHKFKI